MKILQEIKEPKPETSMEKGEPGRHGPSAPPSPEARTSEKRACGTRGEPSEFRETETSAGQDLAQPVAGKPQYLATEPNLGTTKPIWNHLERIAFPHPEFRSSC